MKIFVTGGSGFIGSNYILKQILSNDNIVLNIDKLTYAGNSNNLANIVNHPNYTFVHGDICDMECVSALISQFQPNIIVHFAAESHVDRSIENPLKFINTNVMGTATLLKSALHYLKDLNNNFRFVHISTDEVFGSLTSKGLFDEDTAYNPSSPYSASKAGADHLVKAWIKSYDFPAIITNCSNNYGPYQFPEKLIPLMITNCLGGKKLPIYGDGKNIRDWLYVNDHCDAIDAVIEHGQLGETYNIGGGNEIENLKLVDKICTLLDEFIPRSSDKSYRELITFVKDRPGHDYRYAIDSSKIKNELGWAPKEDFGSGLQKTIEWYINNKDWWQHIQNINYN